MQITVNVPERLAAEAKTRGMAVETFVEQVLQQRAGEAAGGTPQSATEVNDWLEALARYSDKIPPLPEVISREWLYQDHD